MCVKMVPDNIPKKRLLSSFTNDKFKGRYIQGDRNISQVSESYTVPEESSTSHTDITKRQNEEQEDDPSEGCSLICSDIVYSE